jgi:hypothetical protein
MILTRDMSSGESLNYDRHSASKIEAQISTFHMVFKRSIISEQIIGLFYELSKQFIHSPIIIATTEPPSRITRKVFPVLSCSTDCGTIAPAIVQRRHPTNRRDSRAPRSGFDAPRWTTACRKWRWLVAEQPVSFEIFGLVYCLQQLSIRRYFNHNMTHKGHVQGRDF